MFLVTDMVLRELSLLATNQGTKQELYEALQLAALKGIKPVTQVCPNTISNVPTKRILIRCYRCDTSMTSTRAWMTS